jgi:hypothetical protein
MQLRDPARQPDFGEVLLLPALGARPAAGALQADAELEAALDVRDRAHGHEAQHRRIGPALNVGARALARDDEPVVAQARQRLADDGARGAEAPRQLELGGQRERSGYSPETMSSKMRS